MSESAKQVKNILHMDQGKIIKLLLMGYDILATVIAFIMALWIRFDCRYGMIPEEYIKVYSSYIFFFAGFCVVVHYIFRLYNSIWKFAGYMELVRTIMATVITALVHVVVTLLFIRRMPISYYLFGTVLQFLAIMGVRFVYRFVLLLRGRNDYSTGYEKRVMIVGAGSTGELILRDIRHARELNERVCCFIDDDTNKWGRSIDGIIVFGGRDSIMEACDKFGIEKIYVAIPRIKASERRNILQICNETGCDLRNLPGMYQLYTGELTVSKMKKVAVEDLLGRDPIKADLTEVYDFIEGKTILVTGVGSIGSEICRQVVEHEPKQLILFDIYENNAYAIQQELKSRYPKLDLVTIIGSVRDSRKIFKVFEDYHPDVVYHAAAHKHVPLMEDSPCEAIKNNVIGTYKTAYAAMSHGCQRFVLISTDKAVNPTNIMGASKRLCEMVVQAFDARIKEGRACDIPQLFTHSMDDVITDPKLVQALKETRTEFVAVRFGNVLGSNGSVIPLFKRQIERGGPVTVTHPDIIRYFMTIPEAVSLVLLAGTFARGGEIFVLDMGEPVKIDTLARNLIRLSGYKPDVDIKIAYTGLRPGEKLYEEKLMAEEGLKKTDNDLIHIGCPIPFDTNVFLSQLNCLMEAAYKNKDDICQRVEKVVSTYHPQQ